MSKWWKIIYLDEFKKKVEAIFTSEETADGFRAWLKSWLIDSKKEEHEES